MEKILSLRKKVIKNSFVAEETDSNADRYRESDRSSNLSDVKADIRAGSSVSNAESVTALDSEGEGSTRGVNALALAGPVPNPLGYRYSADYTEPSFPPKNNVSSIYTYRARTTHCFSFIRASLHLSGFLAVSFVFISWTETMILRCKTLFMSVIQFWINKFASQTLLTIQQSLQLNQ